MNRIEDNKIKYKDDFLYCYVQLIVDMNKSSAINKTFYYDINKNLATISNIFGRFYIGNVYTALSGDILKQHGIKNILNCASNDIDNNSFHYLQMGINYHGVPARDTQNPDYKILEKFKNECFSFIHHTEGPILIHCMAGEIRSVTIFIAYLMKHLGVKFNDAINLVSKSRPNILYNPSFCHQLDDYAKELNLA